jgi:hypothetical protein
MTNQIVTGKLTSQLMIIRNSRLESTETNCTQIFTKERKNFARRWYNLITTTTITKVQMEVVRLLSNSSRCTSNPSSRKWALQRDRISISNHSPVKVANNSTHNNNSSTDDTKSDYVAEESVEDKPWNVSDIKRNSTASSVALFHY